MSTTPAGPRFTLRDLPLPAKVVVTCFLLAVGLGYTTAMVQLHFQDSKSGKPMPTVEDVILKFTGKKWFETDPPKPTSKFVKLLVAPAGEPFNGSGTMLPAFTTRDGAEFSKAIRGIDADRARLQPERDGERDAVVLWAESPPDVRKKAFEDDHFGLEGVPADKRPKAMTPAYRSDAGAIRVKSILEQRCTRCHKPDGDDSKAASYPLVNYADFEKYLAVPATVQVGPGGGWVRVVEPMELDKLTQSTHAHLLSFAVLFSLTGLVFAFTSYPTVVRCVVGPWVLIAIVTDVTFWWLARMSEQYGVYFAMGVIGTGGAAGMGLAAQILLSLWNMYGPKGKLVLLLLFALGGAAMLLVFLNVVKPGLDAKQKAKSEDLAAKTNGDEGTSGDTAKKTDTPPKKDDTGNGSKKDDTPPKKNGEPPVVGRSAVHRMLLWPVKGPDGKEPEPHEWKWGAEHDGGMVRAFFDKDKSAFAQAKKDKDEDEMKRLAPERHGEMAALTAWGHLPDAERKKAYEADAFDLPPALAGKPFTPEFVAAGKVKIKSIVETRCIGCHAGEEKADFSDYDTLRPFLEPQKPAGK